MNRLCLNCFRARKRFLSCPIASLVGHLFFWVSQFVATRKTVPRERVPAILAAAAVVALAACASAKPAPSSPPVNLAGFPLAFKEGYSAGCYSARADKVKRDAKRFSADRQYASGWRDGFDACGPRPAGSKRAY